MVTINHGSAHCLHEQTENLAKVLRQQPGTEEEGIRQWLQAQCVKGGNEYLVVYDPKRREVGVFSSHEQEQISVRPTDIVSGPIESSGRFLKLWHNHCDQERVDAPEALSRPDILYLIAFRAAKSFGVVTASGHASEVSLSRDPLPSEDPGTVLRAADGSWTTVVLFGAAHEPQSPRVAIAERQDTALRVYAALASGYVTLETNYPPRVPDIIEQCLRETTDALDQESVLGNDFGDGENPRRSWTAKGSFLLTSKARSNT